MTFEERVKKVDDLLRRDYPIVQTPLLHNNVYELIISVMMSAQTLDATVNKKTPALFKKYPTVQDLAKANIEEVTRLVAGVNYFHTKAKNMIALANKVVSEFNGEIPSTMEDLTSLPGIGRKTANVVIGEWFSRTPEFRYRAIERQHEGVTDGRVDGHVKPGDLEMKSFIDGFEPSGFVVDTHVMRVSQRLGLTNSTTPEKVEKDLMRIFPKSEWTDVALRMIFHGRYRCTARNPKCYLDSEWSKICSCVGERKLKT